MTRYQYEYTAKLVPLNVPLTIPERDGQPSFSYTFDHQTFAGEKGSKRVIDVCDDHQRHKVIGKVNKLIAQTRLVGMRVHPRHRPTRTRARAARLNRTPDPRHRQRHPVHHRSQRRPVRGRQRRSSQEPTSTTTDTRTAKANRGQPTNPRRRSRTARHRSLPAHRGPPPPCRTRRTQPPPRLARAAHRPTSRRRGRGHRYAARASRAIT